MKPTPPAVVAVISAALVLLSVESSFAKAHRSDVAEDADFEFEGGSGPEFAVELAPNATDGETSGLLLARSKRSDIPANCQWSACQGMMILGQSICNQHGAGYIYVGYTKSSDCKWDSSRSECCKPGSNRRWGKLCYGIGYAPVYACAKDFGHGVVPTGQKKSCSSAATTRYECAN